ncbi:CCDC90 family protein [Symbiopectobacterium purcellii]|uniref:CCDC90 family protein n=1 Tax=Symbiopectobacterium purcellii TaxID=2871826 RepID=A0ABX9AU69_9ENTR|nr:CCDC90 family protein [Symbiopectobacterium purcellii]QZN97320.1 CCDC90 family protein [Symbiopectobacterium purcellii]
MGQVAFDTLQASEELETAGISREQAKAISLVVRKSHEVADVATKADIAEVNRNVADVRKDMAHRFEKTDAQIADVRKDIDARFEKNEAQMQARFEKTEAQISLVRKDLQLEMAGIRSEQKLMRWMLSAGILGIISLVVKAFLVTAL